MDKSITEQELRNVQKRKLDLEIEALSTSRYWYIAFAQKVGRWVVRNSGVFALLIASAGAVFGLIQYYETVQRDFRKPLWEKQLNLYLEATGAAAKLVELPNDHDPIAKDEYKRSWIKFWELYYGELAVVEDPDVSAAMVNFGTCLRQYQTNECDTVTLKRRSLELAATCRRSVSTSWKQNLRELGNRP
jgi:hypothetical protein